MAGVPKPPPRVLILTHSIFPSDSRIEKEVSSLLSKGFDVTVVANKSLTKNRVRSFLGAEVLYVWMAFPLGIPILNLPGLVHTLKNHRFVTMQTCDAPLGLIAVPLSMIYRLKLVYDAHETWPLLALFAFRNLLVGLASAPLLFLSELVLVRHARKVITVSEGVRSFMARSYGCSPAKIQIIRNYPSQSDRLPQARPREPSVKDSFKLVYIGGIDGLRRNELSRFIRAMKILRDISPAKYTLTIVGAEANGRPAPEALVSLAGSLGVSDCVKFTGWIPHEETLRYASSADLGLIGCEKNAYSDLGLANKLFEYILVGLPVLTADLSEFRRVVGERISYYQDNDPRALAKTIEDIRSNYSQVQLRALELENDAISRMTWGNEEEMYVGIFNSTVV